MRVRNSRATTRRLTPLTTSDATQAEGHTARVVNPDSSADLGPGISRTAKEKSSLVVPPTPASEQEAQISQTVVDEAADASTPLAARPPRKSLHSSSRPVQHAASSMRQLFSPLPPSSPPTPSSDDLYYGDENAPPPPPVAALDLASRLLSDDDDNDPANDENKENEFDEENEHVDAEPLAEPEAAVVEVERTSPSSDDQFGFKKVERDLKAKREMRRRGSFAPPAGIPLPRKGKERARSRAPFGEISFEPVASSSAVKERAPTPYHQSDDLEDMYMDPIVQNSDGLNEALAAAEEDEENENALMSPPPGLEGLEEEMDEEEAAELEREQSRQMQRGKGKAKAAESASSYSDIDPLRTPHPQHVANIYPLRSPFSSREGTPCDRSLAGSLPSSPSPMKPLTVLHPLSAMGSMKKTNGKLRALLRSTLTPQSALKARPKPHIDTPPMKRRRVTVGKENDLDDDPHTSEAVLDTPSKTDRLLPKRATRRTTRATSTPAPPLTRTTRAATQAQTKAGGRGTAATPGKVLVADSQAGDTSEPDFSSPSSPVAPRKRKAPIQPRPPPAKKAKTQPAAARAGPSSRRSAKPSSGVRTQTKAKANAKGKGKAGPAKLEGEDSDEARARQARIEYFKNLDKLSLETENVYVV